MEPLAEGDPRQAGGYRLEARLGAGGMGTVFLGRSPAGRSAAVKLVHPELARDPGFRERFRREVRAAQAVSGAFTAPVMSAGPDDDPPWLATAFVAGPSLDEIVAGRGPMPEETVWRLAGGLIEALQAVHGCGLVHRDLKPGNVLIAADGPRVIDFGIAKALEGTALTGTSLVIGTPVGMAPEQARGESPGVAGDVFSLGSVLAYAATGRMPFSAGAPVAVLYRIVHDEPDLDGLSPSLREMVSACLTKDPAGRPLLGELLDAVVARLVQFPATSPGAFWPDAFTEAIARFRGTSPPSPLIDTGPRPSPPAAVTASGEEATRAVPPRLRTALTAGETAALRTEEGDRLCDEGRYVEAEHAYRAAIVASPDFAYARASLAVPLAGQGRYAEADAACRTAISLDPGSVIAHQNLGYVLTEQGRHEAAAAAYREVVRLDPDNSEGYIGLGDALRELQRLQQAEQAYREGIRRDPRSGGAYRGLAGALFELNRDNEALEAYRQAVRLDPDDPDSYQGLGDVLFELNLDDEAESAYRAAVRIAPYDPDCRNKLGELLYGSGRRREAAAEFRAARRLKKYF